MSVSEKLLNVLPALRMILMGDGESCILRLGDGKRADVSAGAADCPQEQLSLCRAAVEQYEKQNGSAPRSIVVEGLGTIERIDGAVSCGRLKDKIAIVTGSAQGFGYGVAVEMLREGAYVVIADLNLELAQKNAAALCGEYGEGRAVAVGVDVSNEESVQNMILETVKAYGGLDIFVNNAGVLKAGGLEEMDVRSFEFVTKINYTAYFVCVKYASEVLKIQHQYKPDYYTDIIQINSKSGLSGSNKNFAYAGGKFGGIGLTQSFALELVGDNIKVNSICPGNFLDGPLWMDPEKGLFVQYLNAGKVPGAKTVEDVRRFYEAKVPMNRGCECIDVARAIFYCVEQKYETGQAVPVTGGQNMLR